MSSVYDDLRKVGNIVPKKLPQIQTLDSIPISTVDTATIQDRNTTASSQPEHSINIEDIALMISPPLCVVRDKNGIVHDTSTIVIKCARNHLHKYFIKDVLSVANNTKGSTINCATCCTGTIFSNTVRVNIEDILGAPFAIDTSDAGCITPNTYTYVNPILKIKVVCVRMPGHDNCVAADGYLTINIHHTTSLKKIKNIIYESLHNYAILSEKQKLAIQHTRARAPSRYIKSPPPLTRHLAKLNNISSASPNILDDEHLCIENC